MKFRERERERGFELKFKVTKEEEEGRVMSEVIISVFFWVIGFGLGCLD